MFSSQKKKTSKTLEGGSSIRIPGCKWYFPGSFSVVHVQLLPLDTCKHLVRFRMTGPQKPTNQTHLGYITAYTLPKFNMEPQKAGFQKDSPIQGCHFQVPC